MKILKNYGPFPLAVALGAFLLFQVQPIIGKYFLPWFGGSPAVWMTCLMFFQLLLLGGYAYAHFLQNLCSRRQLLVHAILLTVAIGIGICLFAWWGSPILPAASLRPTGNEAPTWHIFRLLLISIGFPYFLLSTSASLLQAWFHKVNNTKSPYVFYVFSNAASLLALISYPVIVEPNLTIKTQAFIWGGTFVAYTLLCLCCISKVWKSPQPEEQPATEKQKESAIPSRPVRWTLLSFCGVLALMAITNQMTQNIPPVPFLWILPLSLYLLSFMIGFAEKQRGWQVYYVFILICALALAGHLFQEGVDLEIKKQVAKYCFVLMAICLFCHNALYRTKPDPRHLTGFYLSISLGGALGGLFVVVVAPFLFKGYWEYPLCLILSAGLAIWITYTGKSVRAVFGKFVYLFPLLLIGYVVFLGQNIAKDIRRSVYMERNFFGVVSVEVRHAYNLAYYNLMHGKINHGTQIDNSLLKNKPTTYYTEKSGVGRALLLKQKSGPIKIGMIGMGIGTLAAYGRDGDIFRMYEIDPTVIRLAEDSPWFSYLSDCPSDITVVKGDGRISLENELREAGSNQFDLLVLDAFSGDSPPAHLLTLEAFALYLSHLKENGILAVNITNRYLDLLPVLDRAREAHGLQMAYIETRGDQKISTYAQWVLLTRSDSLLKDPSIARVDGLRKVSIKPIRPWTDEFSNLLNVVK